MSYGWYGLLVGKVMAKIRELINAVDGKASEEYKKGWREAVCYINDFYKMVRREDGEPVEIVIGLEVSEEQILEKIKQLLEEQG